AWVKEGRKYDLGAVLVTQQPGSIPVEILSQGDNWFIFHLLAAADLYSLSKANAHFSDDLLSSLLNEPIPGQGVFWSSVGGQPYPVPLRVLLFEDMYPMRDPGYDHPAADTYATRLREEYRAAVPGAREETGEKGGEVRSGDVLAAYEEEAARALRSHQAFMAQLHGNGLPWSGLLSFLES